MGDGLGVIGEKYELLERIGSGGMAEVFRARYRGMAGAQRDVVIKRMLPFPDEERAEMDSLFVTEARLSMQLSHGNVVQVFEFGEEDGRYYLVMELVEGVTLATLLNAVEQLEAPVAVAIMIEVLRGLHYAHTRTGTAGEALKIVHRDVSPDNVLLGRDGQVKLTDFGIARASMAGRARTEPGVYRGKMSYSSPEQLRADPVDARADVYACGIVLWKCLTGVNPQAELALKLAMGAATLPPPPDSIDPELAEVLRRATQADPSQRTPSAQQLRAALQKWLDKQDAPQPEMAISQLVTSVMRKRSERSARALPKTAEPVKTVTHTTSTTRETAGKSKYAALGVLGLVLVAGSIGLVINAQEPEVMAQDPGLRPLPRLPVVPPAAPPPKPAPATTPLTAEPQQLEPLTPAAPTWPHEASGAPASFKLSSIAHGTDVTHLGLKLDVPGEKTTARLVTTSKTLSLFLAPMERGPIGTLTRSSTAITQPSRAFIAQPTGWSSWENIDLEVKWTQAGVTRTRSSPRVLSESMTFMEGAFRLNELDARVRYRVSVSGTAPVLVVAEKPSDRLRLRTGDPSFSGFGPPWQRLITGGGSVEVRGAASLRFGVLTWPGGEEQTVEVTVSDSKSKNVVIEKGSAEARAMDRTMRTSDRASSGSGSSYDTWDAQTAEQCQARAETLISRGRGKDAIPYLDKCLRLQPSNTRCSVLLGRAKSM